MENNSNQEQNTAAQAEQNQASNNTNVGTQDKPLTTEDFHTLLEANTFELSKARKAVSGSAFIPL